MNEDRLSHFCQKALLVLVSLALGMVFVWEAAAYSLVVKCIAAGYLGITMLLWRNRQRLGAWFTVKHCRVLAFLLIGLAFGAQLFVAVTQAAYTAHGDVGAIMTGAGEIEQFGHLVEDTQYFLIYPHQLFTALFYACLNRGFVICGATQAISAVPSAIVNCALVSLGTVFLYFAVETMFQSRLALVSTLLICSNVSYLTQVTFLYGHTLSAVFSGAAVWCAAKAFRAERGRAAWWLLCGAVFCIAKSVEGILAIGIVAVCIGILFLRQTYGSRAVAIAALLGGYVAVSFALNGFYRYSGIIDLTNAENERLPVTHWIMMGLSDSEEGPGMFCEEDYQTMVHLETAQEKKAYSVQQIKERFERRSPAELLKLWAEKESRIWLSVRYGGHLVDSLDDGFDATMGRALRLYLTFLVLAGAMFQFPKRKAACPHWNVFVYSWIVGLFLFFLLWESNIIYLHSSQFLLVLGATVSLRAICDT